MISAFSNFSSTKPAPVWDGRQFTRETRRLSHGPVDGVVAAWHRIDAIDANLKFRKPQKRTLTQHRRDGKIPIIIAALFSGDAEKAGWSNAVASKMRRAQGAFARPLLLVE